VKPERRLKEGPPPPTPPRKGEGSTPSPRRDLDAAPAQAKARLLGIIKAKSLLLGEFKLVSGAISNYYLDMKPTMFDPEGAHLVAELVCDLIADERDVEAIGGLELGAVPIIVAVCARSWHGRPVAGFVVRKEIKDHGTEQKIDGNFTPGSTVILFDDVTTKGGSVMKAVRAVRARGARVAKIITLVDRLEGASENLGKEGIELVALYTTRDLLG
jgi:orotate phosphoribosyltransferase